MQKYKTPKELQKRIRPELSKKKEAADSEADLTETCTTAEGERDDQTDILEWSSLSQHLLFFFSYLMTYSGTGCLLLDNPEGSSENVTLQILVCCLLFGNPVLYLQTSIGQFTRGSCLFLGEMFPLLTGLGYSMILLSFFELIPEIFYTAMLLYYLLVNAFNLDPPWMECYRIIYEKFPNCISRRDIDLCPTAANTTEPCFPPGVTLSALLFKDVIAFEKTDVVFDQDSQWFVSEPSLRLIFHLANIFVVFVFLILASNTNTKTFYVSLRVWSAFYLVLILLTLAAVVTQQGVEYGLFLLFRQVFNLNCFTVKAWTIGFRKMIEILKLAEGGHILYGAFIPKSNADNTRSLILIAAFCVQIIGIALYFHLFIGLLTYKLNMNIGDLMNKTEENIIFVLCPTFLGLLPSAYFFSFIFFLIFSTNSLLSIVIKIKVIETAIAQHFNVQDYQVYIKLTICSLLTASASTLIRLDVLEEYKNLLQLSKFCGLIIVALQLFVTILYGIDRISDDIQYMVNAQVSNFVKFAWILVPILCCLTGYDLLKTINFSLFLWIKLLFLSLLSMPFLIGFIVRLFLFSKQQNFIGIVRPTDLYGPPDPEERIMRVLYNPSLIVKYKRRVEVCDHDCLLQTDASKTAIKEEIRLINTFLNGMEREGVDKYLEKGFISLVKKQKKYLLRMIQKENLDDVKEEGKNGS